MRGPAYPPDAAFHREQSHEFGSPTPSYIDPSLTAPPYAQQSFYPNGDLHLAHSPVLNAPPQGPSESLSPTSLLTPYSQGPQGDPFAPQPPTHFFPKQEETTVSPQKPIKRKRRGKKGDNCGQCGGTDSSNKEGVPEQMVHCDECGLAVHPSCHDLARISENLFSYAWKCVECKNCEVCQEKGAEDRMMFCDNCDRGWHMDCLTPKLEDNPDGQWHCPVCPPLPVEPTSPTPIDDPQTSVEPEIQIDPALQQMEIDPALVAEEEAEQEAEPGFEPEPELEEQAMDDVPIPQPRRGKGKGKGKAKAPVFLVEDDSEVNVDAEGGAVDAEMDVEDEEPAIRSTSKRKIANGVGKKTKYRSRRRSLSIADDVPPPSPPPRPQKRARIQSRHPSPVPPAPLSSPKRIKLPVRLRLSLKGKGKAKEDEEDEEARKGMFDDYLSLEDRDTTKTVVSTSDKERFEKSRVVAEARLMPPPEKPTSPLLTPGPSSSSRFPLRSAMHQHQQNQQAALLTPTSPSPSTPGPGPYSFSKLDTGQLRIRTLRFGSFDISTWYDAPFPEEFSNIPDGRLWMCEFCLKYMKSRFGAQRHRLKCKARHPPGDEIYRDGNVSIFEVDGRKNKIYCQNLCLLSKMFLDHKSLFYDVEPFLFYVMTEVDDLGAHFVGYFSKEKRNSKDLNLSCIMTLPVRQRKGWGSLLIDFSYLLSKKEQVVGTPERPLSGLGALGYKNYWTLAIMRYLQSAPENPRLEDISAATSMTLEDICLTLNQLEMIKVREATPQAVRPSPGKSIRITRGKKTGTLRKYMPRPKGEEDKSKRPFMPPMRYDIHWAPERVEEYLAAWEKKGYLKLKPDRLKWTPFLLSRRGEGEALDGMGMVTATASNTSQQEPSEVEYGAGSAMGDGGQSTKAGTMEDRFKEFTPAITPRKPTNGLEQLAELALAMQPMSTPVPQVNGNFSGVRLRSADKSMEKYLERAASPTPTGRMTRTRSSRSAKNDEGNFVNEMPKPLTLSTNGVVLRRTRSHQVISSPEPEAEEKELPSASVDSGENFDSILDKDAALAAKLALEEARPPPRRLRSTSSRSAHEPASPSVIEPIRPSSTRRRPPPRLESPETPVAPTPRRPATRSVSAANATPDRSSRRLSSRLNNNNTQNEDSPSVRTRSSRNDLRVSKRINGVKPQPMVSTVNVDLKSPKKSIGTRRSARVRRSGVRVEVDLVSLGEEHGTPEPEQEAPAEIGVAGIDDEGSDADAEGEEVDEDVDAEGEVVDEDEEEFIGLPQAFVTVPASGVVGGDVGVGHAANGVELKVASGVVSSPTNNDKAPSSSSSLHAAAYPTPFSVTSASPVVPNGVHPVTSSNLQAHDASSKTLSTKSIAYQATTSVSLDELGSDVDAEGEIDIDGEEWPNGDFHEASGVFS